VSVIRYQRGGLTVSTFAGPEGCNPHAGGRTCIQIDAASPTGSGCRWMTMGMDDWIDLVCFIRSLDERGIGITSAPEVS
jgi:hypothetical protein